MTPSDEQRHRRALAFRRAALAHRRAEATERAAEQFFVLRGDPEAAARHQANAVRHHDAAAADAARAAELR